MTLMLNMMLCIDLILIIRYPFSKKDGRTPVQLSISMIMSIAVTCTMLYEGDDKWIKRLGYYLYSAVLYSYLLCFFGSGIYACMKLGGPGMSKQVRMLVVKRHVLTGFLYILSNIYYFKNATMMLRGPNGKVDMNTLEPTVW